MASSSSPTSNRGPALREAYEQVQQRIAAAAARVGRKSRDILLLAVTKTASPDQIRQLVEMGHQDFAENRVQHLAQRVAQLQEFLARRAFSPAAVEPERFAPRKPVAPPANPGAGANPGVATPRWHMIGHLQRNKVKQVVPLVRLIHSVDSLRFAEELHAYGSRMRVEPLRGRGATSSAGPRGNPGAAPVEPPAIDILIQVNASGEESKFGIAVPAVIHLAEQIDSMMHLRLRGLMTMAPYSDNPEDARPVFARTAELFSEIRTAGLGGRHFNVLSMGMTGDYEVAIEEGANVVRVGRALFGEGEPEGSLEDSESPPRADDAVDQSDEEPSAGASGKDDADAPTGDLSEFAEPAEPDEGPKSAAARKKARQAREKTARARIVKENRSARGGQK